jgi:hypothetical protein
MDRFASIERFANFTNRDTEPATEPVEGVPYRYACAYLWLIWYLEPVTKCEDTPLMLPYVRRGFVHVETAF